MWEEGRVLSWGPRPLIPATLAVRGQGAWRQSRRGLPQHILYISNADPDPFDTDPDPAFHFDTDPYRFKEVMYLKQYFLYTFN